MRIQTVLTVLAVIGLTACDYQTVGLGEDGAQREEPGIPDDASATSFDVIYTAELSGVLDARRTVIRDPEAWSSFWAEATSILLPEPPVPAVDFDNEMVIVAASGERTTGGYTIAIDEVLESDVDLFVVVKESSPGADCVVTQALTAPVTAVRVARSDGSVSFEEVDEELSCG